MTVGKNTEKRSHVIGFKEEISKAAASSDNDFFTWFNNAKDKEAAFVRGYWDFAIHIAQPCAQFLSNPEDKVALEIGHGGGRLLSASSRFFKNVIGVDIHQNNLRVKNELISRGIDNIYLLETSGNKIPLENDSVDLVYSFIVLQHVEKYEIFKNYLVETYRILKSKGIAILYFGRKCTLSLNKSSKILYVIDKITEPFFMPRGFMEFPARVNDINLIISLSHAKILVRDIGFEILDELVSRKNVPDGTRSFGGQNGLIIKKS
jgi:ubiquinone/menaquinone biosynthesis C-methylase UbiE